MTPANRVEVLIPWRQSASAGGGVKAFVVSADARGERASTATHPMTVTLPSWAIRTSMGGAPGVRLLRPGGVLRGARPVAQRHLSLTMGDWGSS